MRLAVFNIRTSSKSHIQDPLFLIQHNMRSSLFLAISLFLILAVSQLACTNALLHFFRFLDHLRTNRPLVHANVEFKVVCTPVLNFAPWLLLHHVVLLRDLKSPSSDPSS